MPQLAPYKLKMQEFLNSILESSSSEKITTVLIAPIISAFAGGFFAAFWSNKYESKRRMDELRMDKYLEHRNTIVQLEHELIPERVSMSRNLASFVAFKEGTNETRFRILLRLYKLTLSPGLTLKLLNMDVLNEYADLYSMLESINLDIVYHDYLSDKILNDAKEEKIDESVLSMYATLVENLQKNCLIADEKSEILLAKCKAIVDLSDVNIKSEYIKNGGTIKYSIPNTVLQEKRNDIVSQEKPLDHTNRIQFVAPYMDLVKPAR